MATNPQQDQAVGVLQELGLKEYEAKCFVALSRLSSATAKDISEVTDVPRTRIYDAIRVLEAKGLVEIQHSTPQRFRAVPVDEAIQTLESQFDSRVGTLRDSLTNLEPVETEDDESLQEVWALSGNQAIANRARELIDEATEEIVLVVGSEDVLDDDLLAALDAATGRATVIVGALSEATQARIREAVPEAEVFVTGLEWLHGVNDLEDDAAIGRLLLVDRETLLVSSIEPDTGKEQSIFGRGFRNGLVVIARRLMATGLVPARDPGQ